MKRILVIDDDLDILELMSSLLRLHDYEVAGLHEWEKTAERIDQFHPDIIILDVSLHGADGREICRELSSSGKTSDIPIILFSADHVLGKNYRDHGAVGFIPKPFDLAELLEAIGQFSEAGLRSGQLAQE